MWSSGVYGQTAAPVAVEYVTSQDPTLPTRRVASSTGPVHYFNTGLFRIWGALVAIMAASTLALGIADVVLTRQQYCNPPSANWCSSSAEPYIWVWVASGIWASIPIFLCGVFAICIPSNPYSWTRCFALLCMLSGIVFAPAMVVLSAIEVYRGSTSTYTFYTYNGGSLAPGTIMPSPNPYQAKFGIPLAIAIIGGVEFLLTFIITLCLCCCMHCLGIYMPSEIGAVQGGTNTTVVQQPVATRTYAPAPAPPPPTQVIVPATNNYYYPPRPQIRNPSILFENINNSPNDPYALSAAPLPYSTRWNSVPNPYGSGAMFGNFVNRGPSSFAQQMMQPNPAYFWQ